MGAMAVVGSAVVGLAVAMAVAMAVALVAMVATDMDATTQLAMEGIGHTDSTEKFQSH